MYCIRAQVGAAAGQGTEQTNLGHDFSIKAVRAGKEAIDNWGYISFHDSEGLSNSMHPER